MRILPGELPAPFPINSSYVLNKRRKSLSLLSLSLSPPDWAPLSRIGENPERLVRRLRSLPLLSVDGVGAFLTLLNLP